MGTVLHRRLLRSLAPAWLLLAFVSQLQAQAPAASDWQTVKVPPAGLSFEMPGTPETKDTQYTATIEGGNTVFKVTYALGEMNLEGEAQARLDAMRDAEVAAVQGNVKSEEAATFKGHPGRSLQVTIPGEGGMEIRYRMYIIENRVVEMIVITSENSKTGPFAINHFFNSLKLIPVGPAAPSPPADGKMAAAFDQLDGNQDGVLSGQEAASVMNFDQNGDGEITRQEYQTGMQTKPLPGGNKVDRATAEEHFSMMDVNQDGRLSGTEMVGQEQMDANGDKRITLQEYLAAVMTPDPEDETSEARTVIIPQGQQPFTISLKDCVRLQGQGIAGSEVKLDLSGPGQLLMTNRLQYMINGRPAVGALTQEFEIVPTGAGTITAKITITYPNTPQTRVFTYQFTAE